MASTTYNSIIIEQVNRGGVKFKEALGGVAITPGELLAFNASNALIPHGTANGAGLQMVAVESPTAVPSSSTAIDTDYASGDTVKYYVPQRGDVLYMWLADGENVDQGDPLSSDGNGDLQEPTVDAALFEGAIKFYAAQDLDNSSGGARARIKVEAA